MRKLVERAVLFILGTLCIVGILFLSFTRANVLEPIDTTNKWFKVATDDATTGDIVILDMSRGYAYSNTEYIILVVSDSEGYDTMIVLPNGGYWTAPELNPDIDDKVEWKRTY
jgi:hypothetical protein